MCIRDRQHRIVAPVFLIDRQLARNQLCDNPIAQKLLSQLDNAKISQATGLNVEDVQNLRGDS